MGSIMSVGFVRIALASVLLASATGVHAQLNYSEGYKFLEAVRDAKGQDVTDLLAKPGTTVINSHDRKNGEGARSEEHTSELQSLMRTSYAVFCLIKKITQHNHAHLLID